MIARLLCWLIGHRSEYAYKGDWRFMRNGPWDGDYRCRRCGGFWSRETRRWSW